MRKMNGNKINSTDMEKQIKILLFENRKIYFSYFRVLNPAIKIAYHIRLRR